MDRRGSVTVAGAGAIGLTCALALADAGFRVTVCDPAPPAFNASGVAAGMLAPVFERVLDDAAPPLPLLLAARDAWAALEARAGVRLERSGAIAAGRADWLHAVAAGLDRFGLHAPEVPRSALQALAPGLDGPADGFLLSREDWRLDPPSALAQLRRAAEASGVTFRAEAADALGGADLLVIATGAGRSLAGLAPELAQLAPIKGHILRVWAPELSFVTVRGEGGYVTPVAGGLAVGATMEAGLDDSAPDPAKAEPLLARGAALFSGLRDAPHDLMAGVRGAAPDGLPLVGFSSAPNVLLAAGARRNGWLLAPLTARLVAALAADRDPGPWAARLDPQRFASDPLK
jgi:glycine oxidase